MRAILQFIKDWTLLFAILVGGIFNEFFGYIYTEYPFVTPSLIFIMLLLTFSKLENISFKISSLHIWLISIQLIGSAGLYFLFAQWNTTLAQGAMICLLVPTATSVAVVTNLLKVDIKFVTSYLFLSNFITAITIPIFLAFIGIGTNESIWQSTLVIAKRVLPTVVLPMLIVIITKEFAPKIHKNLQKYSYLTFYIWSFALTLVIGRTINSFLIQENTNYFIEISLAVGSFFLCITQFGMGRMIGAKYGERIAAGQALGQKNTIFAIWMAQTYLSPLVSIAPAAYVLWQNTINSYQIWKARTKK